MRHSLTCCFIFWLYLSACGGSDQAATQVSAVPTLAPDSSGKYSIVTGKTTPAELVAFAQTLQGIPYKYASADPAEGFDCSGFITYVFNHFGIAVPRSSVDFTNVPKEVALEKAQTGDLVLFTGTDSTIRTVGHMGIVVSAAGEPFKFIHATSGKAYGVTETLLYPNYIKRYVKTVRVFAK